MMGRIEGKRGDSGFTTIELLVVIAIIGIMATIAIPTFRVWLPNYRLKSAAMDLYSNMQLAKLKAIRQNANYTVFFDTANNRYQLRRGDGTVERTITFSDYGTGVQFGSGSAVKDWDDDTITETDRVTYGSNQVTFNARGTASPAGTVYVDNGQNKRTYAVTSILNGFIRLRWWDGSSWQ